MTMSVQKVLISFEEYSRLKDIEKQFNSLSQAKDDTKGKGDCENSLNSEQTGSGSGLNFIDIKRIAELVKQEIILPPRPNVTTWQNFQLAEPTIESVAVPLQTQNSAYDVSFQKSDQNDSFDLKKLIAKVPKEHRKAASELLKIIESRDQY